MDTTTQIECTGKITGLFQQQSETVVGYIAYLDSIKEVITKNDAQQLTHLLENNPINLSTIEACREKCFQLVKQQGFEASEQGLSEYIQAFSDARLTDAKAELDKQLKGLEKSLLINDVLIQKNQQRIRQSIKILSGRTSSADGSTYSREGNKDQADSNPRSLARA